MVVCLLVISVFSVWFSLSSISRLLVMYSVGS